MISIPLQIRDVSKLKSRVQDPLYRNSFFMLLTAFTSALFSFLFWLLAAKYYSPADVGIITAIISSMDLIILLSRFGLEQSLIRFFPDHEKNKVFSTTIITTTVFVLIIGIVFAIISLLFPIGLNYFDNYILIFLIFLIFYSITPIVKTSFIAIRRSDYSLLQSLLLGSKCVFLILFISFGSLGLFCAFGIANVVALIFLMPFLRKYGITFSWFDVQYLKIAFRFSFVNYIVRLLSTASTMLLPILVYSSLGADQTAVYYLCFNIASIMMLIPNSICMSLFVEGSHGESLRRITVGSSIAIIAFILPMSFLLIIFGGEILHFIGKDYVQGYDLLKLIVIASSFYAVHIIYFSIKKIQKELRIITLYSFYAFFSVMGLSYYFIKYYDLVGIGYAWIISYGFGALIIIYLMYKEGWFNKEIVDIKKVLNILWLL